METVVKSSLITAFTGKTKDRFHEYNEDKTIEEKFELVSQMEGMNGVEVIFPYEINDAEKLKKLLNQFNLGIAAVNVNVKAEPEFRDGGLTNNDPAIRQRAVQFIKDSKDFAEAVGADKVTCCPLGYGYEFNFQADYRTVWKYLEETFGEAADYKPEITLFVEYKPSETRGRCYVDTTPKTLCLLNDIQNKNMGITLDYGHSLYGQENPAEMVSLIDNSPYGLYVHINDNNGKWDWDFPVCTSNFISYIEFLYYLIKIDYTDYITSDSSPTRWNIKEFFEMNVRLTNKLWKLLSDLDQSQFDKLILSNDYLKTWKFIEGEILSL